MQEKDIIDIDKIADFILEKWRKEKKVVLKIAAFEGLVTVDIDRFIKQPAEGILYDLNRDRMTLLTQLKSVKPEAIDTCRYINDFAAALVIERLMKEIEKLKGN